MGSRFFVAASGCSMSQTPTSAPLPAQEAEGHPRTGAVSEVCEGGQKAPTPRREIPNEAEFLDAIHDLHRGTRPRWGSRVTLTGQGWPRVRQGLLSGLFPSRPRSYTRPASRLAVKALASWMATLASSAIGGIRSLTMSPLTTPFGPQW